MTHLWLMLFLNSWLPIEAQGFGMNLIKVPDDDHAQIVCTVALLGKYFNSGESLSGFVLHMSITSAAAHVQQALLQALHADENYPWSVVVKEARRDYDPLAITQFVMHEKPQCYFIVIENMEDEDMDEIFESWKSNVNWNPLAQFVVFLSAVEETDEEMTDIMIEILLNFMNKKIYNVNVIGQSEESSYYYGKTVFPYHPDNNCGNRVISIEILDICDYQEGEREDDEEEGEEGDEDVEDVEEEEGELEGEGGGEEEGGEMEGEEGGNEEDGEMEGEEGGEEEGGEMEGEKGGKEEEGEMEDEGGGVEEEGEKEGEKGGKEDEGEMDIEEAGEQDNGEMEGEEKQDEDEANIEENKDAEPSENSIENSSTFTNIPNDTSQKSDEELGDQTSITFTDVPATKSSEIENSDEISSKFPNIPLKITTPSEIDNIDVTSSTKEPNISSETENIDVTFSMENTDVTTPSEIENNEEYSLINSKTSLQTTKSLLIEHFNKISSTVPSYALRSTTPSELDPIPPDVEYIDDSEISQLDNKNLPQTQNKNNSIYPKLHIEELYRALFLDKFPKDLSGCPLVAAYRPWEPYIFNEALEDTNNLENPSITENNNNNQTNNTSSGSGGSDEQNGGNDDYPVYSDPQDPDSDEDVQTDSVELHLNGIEYKLIQTIGERLHISIELQVENSNLYHLFQQLIDGDIEMVVGGIDEDPSISQYVSSTVPYHQDDLTWCVARAQRTHNLFNFMATFQIGSWILTLLFILTASLTMLMSQKYLKLHIGFLRTYFSINIYVMGIILSQAVNLRPIPTCLRVCFGTTFFMGLMFSNVYQSFLVSTLTTPKSSYQISHLQEIYQNRMQIMGSVDNVRHLNKDGEIYRYVREQFQMCYNIEDCLQRTATDAKLAVAVSRQHSFYNPRIPRDNLFCFDRNENIYVYLVTMLMPKKFHLLHKINPVIQHIIESGHMQKWARDLDMRRKINEEIQRARKETIKSLTLAQVGGIFIFSSVLLLFAALIFGMEHLAYWLVVKRRTRLKLAKMFHRKFV